jgi:hypothetical protein
MIKLSIREFVNNMPVGTTAHMIDWNNALRNSGYHEIEYNQILNHDVSVLMIAQWCDEHVGIEHHVWTGGYWWFETEQAAMMFALRWK